MVEFDFVLLTSGKRCPRPTFRGNLSQENCELLPPRRTGLGWVVPHEVDHRLAPPESALVLMEAGAGLPEESAQLRQLAAEFRAAIASGHEQAADASSEQQVLDCIGRELYQAWAGD